MRRASSASRFLSARPTTIRSRYSTERVPLAQFEPDPEALDVEATLAATSSGDDSVPWVVFEDADGELAWALDELLQITPRRGVSRVPHARPGEPEAPPRSA